VHGDVLVAVAVAVCLGDHLRVALDIVDYLFFEDGLQHDGTGAGLFHLDHLVHIGRQTATADDDRTLEFESQIFGFCVHIVRFSLIQYLLQNYVKYIYA